MRKSSPLRRDFARAYTNGALWGVGSGLASITLLIYLAKEFSASGRAVAWLIAAPALVGLLRLVAPAWLARVESRRRFCVAMFVASAAALAAVPAVARPGWQPSRDSSIIAVGAAWAFYNLLEYFGAVALWSWFGDLVPPRIRGRFVGRREGWLTAGVVLGGAAAAGGEFWWKKYCEQVGAPEAAGRFYIACAWFGAMALALAALPLARMRDLPRRQAAIPPRVQLGDLMRPWLDGRFRKLLYFNLWFSMANGLVQSPRNLYMASVVALSLWEKKALDASSRGLQATILPLTGNLVDRRGNVPVLAAAQGIIALAPLVLLLAGPEAKWWVAGAYLCWVAYAGHNVALPNLMLSLSPPGQSATYAAAHFAWSQLAFALSVLAGGELFDWIGAKVNGRSFYGVVIDPYAVVFCLGWLLMTLGIVLALRVPELAKLPTETSPAGRREAESTASD